MDTKKLRQKILDLAIRGKLVPQDPNDEPASVLLERIRAEKQQLIKEGKIKAPKGSKACDTSHYEKMPDGWVLTDIGELLTNRDSERIPLSLGVRSKQKNKIFDYYGATGVVDKVDGYLFDEKLLLIGEDGANLLSRSKDNAFFAEGKYWVNNHAHILDCPEKEVLDYVAFLINSMSLEDYITGSAQPKLNQDNLNKIEIPLPPLEEQRRIIAQVRLWQSYINNLDSAENELNKNIESAKSKILDLAIQGKLVPQDSADEPAIELLKRVNPDFKPCDISHYPFEIPDNWSLSTFGQLNNHQSKTINPLSEPEKTFELYSVPIFETGKPEILKGIEIGSTKQLVHKGEVLVCKINPHLNRVWVVEHYNTQMNCIASSEWIVFQHPALLPKYALLYFQSPYFRERLMSNVSGVGGSLMRARPSAVDGYIVSIPPINEQRRIVQAVDKLLDNLSSIGNFL